MDRRHFVEWLGSATGDAAALGGKGASLDRLARLGFRVPPGFCVTTAAFQAQLAALPHPPPHHATDEIGSEIAGNSIEPAVLDAMQAALAQLDKVAREPGWNVRLAVRS